MIMTLNLNSSEIFVVKKILHLSNGWKKKKNNQTYTSPKIQNEILKDISPSILRDVVPKAIKSWDYHSITVNESSDIFNKEQVVFCVCWVDEDLISHEDFIGLYEMEKTDAKRYGRCD